MRFVVFGGGCYGTFYGKQLLRARASGSHAVDEIRIVDHDPDCRAGRELGPGVELEIRNWDSYLDQALPEIAEDVQLVTPPFTPHLALAWMLRRLRAELPDVRFSLEPFSRMPSLPFRHQNDGGPLLLSHADWTCPVHCIEPAMCPATRGPRDWDMDPTVRRLADELTTDGTPIEQVHLFHCHHIAYGVGGYPGVEVRWAFEAVKGVVANSAETRNFLVGTVSRCHGAVHWLRAAGGTLPVSTRATENDPLPHPERSEIRTHDRHP